MLYYSSLSSTTTTSTNISHRAHLQALSILLLFYSPLKNVIFMFLFLERVIMKCCSCSVTMSVRVLRSITIRLKFLSFDRIYYYINIIFSITFRRWHKALHRILVNICVHLIRRTKLINLLIIKKLKSSIVPLILNVEFFFWFFSSKWYTIRTLNEIGLGDRLVKAYNSYIFCTIIHDVA